MSEENKHEGAEPASGEQITKDTAKAESPIITMRDEEKKPIISSNAKKEIREWVVSLAFAVIAFFLIRAFLFTVIRVEGSSMETTLHDGERLIVTVLDMKIVGPQRGDVVICHYPNRDKSLYFVKRVIGVPGDVVYMNGGVTYVNTEPVDEGYVERPDTGEYGPYTVPEGEYFVMGDNRNHSNDSRSVGFIDGDMFVGKVRLVMWPLSDIRGVH